MKQSRVSAGVPAGGEFTAVAHSDAVPALTFAPPTPSTVLSAAVGTEKAPNETPWPEKPANSRVEVYVDPDDMAGIMDDGNWNARSNYRRVYADIDLIANRKCDFWGIDADGKEHPIALNVHDYEEAVDPFNHENLSYREGFSDPMPAYNAAVEEVKKQRLEASTALLAEAGITVELEDLSRGHYRLKHGEAQSIRLEIHDFHGSRLTETTNWQRATDEHYSAFLDGPADESAQQLLNLAATIVARDLQGKAYKEMYAR